MKKSIFTILVLLLTVNISAQKGSPEKSAKKVADEMTKVLSLNDDESKKVYEIQLDKFTQVRAVKAQNGEDKEKSKAAIKKVTSNTQDSLIDVFGEEKMSTWKAHVKANKKKNKKKKKK
ncbi:MAG: hypothetical protein KUG51_00180 [Urechidicola sp.]|nr:hypothetical protein [Urechidicola sp.]